MPIVHNHTHNHSGALGKRLLVSMVINLLIPVAQIAGGIVAGSMALISDAVHNLGDFAALMVAYAAHKAGKRGPSLKHTFGLRRMEIFAAVVNSALLGGAAVYITVEAVRRIANPTPVASGLVAWLALVGIVGNGLSAWLLQKDSKHNLNARGAFLHMIGDLLTSVAVLIGALIMHFAELPWLDPALSIGIVVYILLSCIGLLGEAVHVLMNGTPRGIDLEAIKAELEAMDEVQGVHYLHVWSVGEQTVALTCHVVVPDQPLSSVDMLTKTIRERLLARFGIDHPVLQFENQPCGNATLLCEMACNANSSSCREC